MPHTRFALHEYFAHLKRTNSNFIQSSAVKAFKADMHIFKSKSVMSGRKTSELNFKYESYRLILIKRRPNLITEHKPAFWKETPHIQLLFFSPLRRKHVLLQHAQCPNFHEAGKKKPWHRRQLDVHQVISGKTLGAKASQASLSQQEAACDTWLLNCAFPFCI